MNKFRRTPTLYLFCFIILSHQILSSVGDGGQHIAQNNEEKPSLAKIVIDTISILKKSHKSSWDKVKNIIHEMQLQFFPPNLDFRSAEKANAEVGAGGKMKEAAEKSFGTSKEAVEASAKTAAKAVGDAVHKTAEKMKDSVSAKDEPHDEL